jgi:hypothetical protein
VNSDAVLEGTGLLGLAGLGLLLLVRGYFGPLASGLADAVSGNLQGKAMFGPLVLAGTAAGQGALATGPGQGALASAQATLAQQITTITGH